MRQITSFTLSILALGVLSNQARAAIITIPDSGFEILYKPGSTSVTATLTAPAFTNSVGAGAVVTTTVPVLYSDLSTGLTTGNTVDVPSWTGTGGIQTGTPETGSLSYTANGGGYGAGSGQSITSGVLATLASGLSYTLTVDVAAQNGTPAAPLLLNLLANGTPLTPTFSSLPTPNGTYQTELETFSAASLATHIGQNLSIKIGTGSPATGQQLNFDNVSLSTAASAVPEPVGLASVSVGLCILLKRRGRTVK